MTQSYPEYDTGTITTKLNTALSLILLGIGIQALALATPVTSPEIDPASAASAFALLAGAVVVIRGRRRK